MENNRRLYLTAEEILKATGEYIELNLSLRLEPIYEVDTVSGSGMWTPLPIHVIYHNVRPGSIYDANKGL